MMYYSAIPRSKCNSDFGQMANIVKDLISIKCTKLICNALARHTRLIILPVSAHNLKCKVVLFS